MQHESNHNPMRPAAASLLVAALDHAWQTIRQHPRTCRRRCWWSPPGRRASGSTWATSRPTAGRSTAATGTRSWSAAKASTAPRWRCWARCCTRPPTASPRLAACRTPAAKGGPHNRRYAQLAGELGLDVASVKPIGWSATTVPEPTAGAYAGQLEELQTALVLWRRQEHRIGRGTRSRNLLAASCSCGRRIRVATATLAEAPILCGACQEPFGPADQDEASN